MVESDIRAADSASSVFLIQDCFRCLGSLCFLTSCKVFCSNSEENVIGSLIEIALNLYCSS